MVRISSLFQKTSLQVRLNFAKLELILVMKLRNCFDNVNQRSSQHGITNTVLLTAKNVDNKLMLWILMATQLLQLTIYGMLLGVNAAILSSILMNLILLCDIHARPWTRTTRLRFQKVSGAEGIKCQGNTVPIS